MVYDYNNIRVEKPTPRIAVMSFIRPEKLNSWNRGVIDDLVDFFTRLQNDLDTSVVVMRGEGTKAYSAGMDFNDVFPAEFQDNAFYSYIMVQRKLCLIVNGICTCPQIVVNLSFGHAIGGGFLTALASNIRIIADNVKFSIPLIKNGLNGTDLGSSYLLWRALGSGVAQDIMLTGRVLKAEEAMKLGFASECVPFDRLDEVGMAKAKELAEIDPRALRLTKQAINFGHDAHSLSDVLQYENRNNQMLRGWKKDNNTWW